MSLPWGTGGLDKIKGKEKMKKEVTLIDIPKIPTPLLSSLGNEILLRTLFFLDDISKE